ncbi:MAG: Cas10/Cmr2 second palm domain-containing protein [bacterium]
MNNKKYIGVTIGPIYQTFSKARKLKEFWCVSYLFSHIMKLITKKVYDKKYSIILPTINDTNIFHEKRVGLFPDWLIFESSNNAYNNMSTYILEAIQETSKLLSASKSKQVYDFLCDYLKIYYIELSVPFHENPNVFIGEKLHQIELHNPIPSMDFVDHLYQIFDEIDKSSLYEEHYLENGKNLHHLSMIAIATKEFACNQKYLNVIEKHKEDEDFFAELSKEATIDIKTYHKYVAIVKADGDKIGRALCSENAKPEELSNILLQWGKNSRNYIDAYGGVPIYISGDDLFFFAPVVVDNNNNIITLIEEISQNFNSLFENYTSDSKPTVSFGISITYYKYPLYEAMALCDELLISAKNKGGNCAEMYILKHSGQIFTMNYVPSKCDLLNKFLQELSENHNVLINSVSHHLRENEEIFSIISSDKDRISAFFENCIESSNTTITKIIRDITIEKCTQKNGSYKEKIHEVYSIIRIVKFLKGLDKNDK